MSARDNKLALIYRDEGAQMLETLEYVVTKLIPDTYRAEQVDQCFRAVHSLKSESALLGFEAVTAPATQIENRLEMHRKSASPFSVAEIEDLRDRIAILRGSFEEAISVAPMVKSRLPEGGQENTPAETSATPKSSTRIDSPDTVGRAGTIPGDRGGAAGLERDAEFAIHVTSFQRQLLREAKGRGEKIYRLECDINPSEPMTYPRLYLLINNLEQTVHVVKTHPDLDSIRDSGATFLQVLLTTGLDTDSILSAVRVDQVERSEVSLLDYDQLLRSDEDAILAEDHLSSGKLVSVSFPARVYEELCINADEIFGRLNQEWTELNKAPIESAIRARIQWNIFLVNRLAGWMRNTITSVSTVPLADILEPLQDVVQSYATRLGKEVRVHVHGEHERVYLPVSDILLEVIVQLVRNAIDHGIESPAVRKERRKPAVGVITVSAKRTDEKLTIRIDDDGNGIPPEDIAKVQEAQSGSLRSAADPVDSRPAGAAGTGAPVAESRDLLSVISHAGFTTRMRADDTSGRGVGLDIVTHSVRKLLCGHLELENKPGQGCSFSIVLPTSTNLMTVLVLQASDEYVSVPRVFVTDSFELNRRFVFTDNASISYYRYNGENVRLYTVQEHFPEKLTLEKSRLGVVIEVAGERGIVVADRLVSEETVVHDRSRRNTVFSQILNRDVRFFLPSQLLSALSFRK